MPFHEIEANGVSILAWFDFFQEGVEFFRDSEDLARSTGDPFPDIFSTEDHPGRVE